MSYLSVYRGDDRTLTITATVDLTGSDVYFTAKRSKRDADADAVFRKSTLDGNVTISGMTATVELEADDTAGMDPVGLYWDVQIVDGDSKVRTVAEGRLAVRADVTREVGS